MNVFALGGVFIEQIGDGLIVILFMRFALELGIKRDNANGLFEVLDEIDRLGPEALRAALGRIHPHGVGLGEPCEHDRQQNHDQAGKDDVRAVLDPALALRFGSRQGHVFVGLVFAHFHLRDSRTLVVRNKNTAVERMKNARCPESMIPRLKSV